MLSLISKLQLVQQIIIVDRVFMVVVVQMVRATDCGSVGHGFDSHQSPKGGLAERSIAALLQNYKKKILLG